MILNFLAGLGLSDVRRQDLLFRNVFHVFAVSNDSSFVQIKNAVGPSLREAAQAMALVYQPGEGLRGGTTKVGALMDLDLRYSVLLISWERVIVLIVLAFESTGSCLPFFYVDLWVVSG